MAKIAFVFPGQGSQVVGMGKDAAERDPHSAELFAQADQIVGFPLSRLCFEGPQEDLNQTQNTQPALAVSSAATLYILRKEGIKMHAAAGHSLGEYTALYAAGVFDFDTLMKLVKVRGEAFANASPNSPQAMAAIIGLPAERVAQICTDASAGQIVIPANINDPNQIVISGDKAAVERACELAKAASAKRALMLPVTGAFHSPLVAPAAEKMRSALAAATLQRPECLFVNNVDAKVLSEPDDIRDSLVRQVTGAVRWVECVQRLIAEGVTNFVEVGSGKVLSGLVRRIDKNAIVHTTESNASIDQTIAALKGI